MLRNILLESTGSTSKLRINYDNKLVFEQHYVGETFGGGVVFYTWSGGTHGYIVTLSPVSTTKFWGYSGLLGTSNLIGTGRNNTLLINNAWTGDTAARYCTGLTWSGYTDWFMPSKDELIEVRKIGLVSNWCMSSSENASTSYTLIGLTKNASATKDKAFQLFAIREF